ncbi:MAG: PilZ domain-containing protein [Xanthomonadales bacterium]|nr:PilZ domain-containing protein [Xanthomonadales bacterium]
MDSLGNERRRFRRFPVEGTVRLYSPKAMWTCDLVDLSLRGCLITRPDAFDGSHGDNYRVDIRLAGGVMIGMSCRLARPFDDRLAFSCQKIDFDSFVKLKRLVEINLGNTEVLFRELAEFSHH